MGEIRAKASRASIQVKPPVMEAYLGTVGGLLGGSSQLVSG